MIANANSDLNDLRENALEQGALRRIATLVARTASPDEIFDVVAMEVGNLLDADNTVVGRYDGDGAATAIGSWSAEPGRLPVGARSTVERGHGRHSSIAAPIVVEGRPWGVLSVATQRPEPFPPDTETRLTQFTELIATAVANAEGHQALERLAGEQAALRRIATLVAREVEPEELFAAVAQETTAAFDAFGAVLRFEDDPPGLVLVVSRNDDIPTGTRRELTEGTASAEVYRTGRSARSGAVVCSPILVQGRVWGGIGVSGRGEPPPDAEQRLETLTDLVSTALANAAARAELAASRRRIVAAADDARRRIERELHDGIQQRLIALTFRARAMARRPPEELPAAAGELSEDLKAVTDELREVSRGIHPAILTEAGLGPALRALARRSTVPVDIDVPLDERLPDAIEAAAYYIASEALTNVAKHAHASVVVVAAALDGDELTLAVRDDGIGGVDADRGSGIRGLTDRVEALGGAVAISSRSGGTTLSVRLPTA